MITAEIALKQLHPKIKKSLYYTKPQDREDLEQELKMKITECIHNDVFEQPPGFWEFAKRFD
jgi:hypothetical protein